MHNYDGCTVFFLINAPKNNNSTHGLALNLEWRNYCSSSMAHILEWRFVIGILSLLHMRFQLLSAKTNNCEVTLALFLEPKKSLQ